MITIIIIILIIFIIINYKTKDRLTNISILKQSQVDSYSDMKTGDLIFIVNKDYQIKLCYFIIVDDDHVQIIQRNNYGYLFLESIDNVLNKYTKVNNYKIIYFPLLKSITNEQKNQLTYSLHGFYPSSQPINVIIRLNQKSIDYFKCPFFLSKILLDLKLLKLGNNINCINDPNECLQEFYKNSSYLMIENYMEHNIIELEDS